MLQPAFVSWPAALMSQFEVAIVPEKELAPFPPLMLQPGPVWRVNLFVCWLLTPSMMSTSPLSGQLGPISQKAGQVPQIPPGMCSRSMINRPAS